MNFGKLKKVNEKKSNKAVENVIECARQNGIPGFVLAFWEGGDSAGGRATVRTEHLTPGSALNLVLVALDVELSNMEAQATKKTPPGYVMALMAFREKMKQSLSEMDKALKQLKP